MTRDYDLDRRRWLHAQRDAINVELLSIHERLILTGDDDHIHGAGTYESPSVWHAHPCDTRDHEHPNEVLQSLQTDTFTDEGA